MSEPEEGHLERGETATFPTRSGVLSPEWVGDLIWLDFPATPARPATMLPELERALGSPIKYLGRTAFDYLIEVESEADVRSLEPDLALLARLGTNELAGYQVSPRGGTVLVRVDGERVHLGGKAVTVLRGELLH